MRFTIDEHNQTELLHMMYISLYRTTGLIYLPKLTRFCKSWTSAWIKGPIYTKCNQMQYYFTSFECAAQMESFQTLLKVPHFLMFEAKVDSDCFSPSFIYTQQCKKTRQKQILECFLNSLNRKTKMSLLHTSFHPSLCTWISPFGSSGYLQSSWK